MHLFPCVHPPHPTAHHQVLGRLFAVQPGLSEEVLARAVQGLPWKKVRVSEWVGESVDLSYLSSGACLGKRYVKGPP